MFTAEKKIIETNGLYLYCVIGNYEAGKYISIINWGVAAELSSSEFDIKYNTEKIYKALMRSEHKGYMPQSEEKGKQIAKEILTEAFYKR